MALVHSHFDTTVGCLYFNVSPIAKPEMIASLLEAKRRRKESPQRRQEYGEMVIRFAEAGNYSLIAHEWAHVLQAITYPALYVRCLRELRAVLSMVDEFMSLPTACPVPLPRPEVWLDDLNLSVRGNRLRITDEGDVAVQEPASGRAKPDDLSEADLLEESASIFQYRAEIGGEGSSESYRHWLKEDDRYAPSALDLVSLALAPADAYIALPALVMAAYTTNRPIQGFALLLTATIRQEHGRPSEIGADAYWSFLEETLATNLDVGAPEPGRERRAEKGLFRIDRDAMLALASRWQIHPLTSLVELAWRDEANARRLREALLHPTLAFNRREQSEEEWLRPYGPPATAYRLLQEGIELGDVPLRFSNTLLAQNPPGPPGATWQGHLIELIRMKAFAFSIATPDSPGSPHNCPHRECAYHRHGVCRDWIDVPQRFEDCKFPTWLKGRLNRRLDLDAGILVHTLSEKEA